MAFGERQMIDVTHLGLKCADCAKEITELPFEPKSDRPVYCRECNQKHRPPRSGGGSGGRSGGGRSGGGRSGKGRSGGRGGDSRGGGDRRY